MAAVAVEAFAVADTAGAGALDAAQFDTFAAALASGWLERVAEANAGGGHGWPSATKGWVGGGVPTVTSAPAEQTAKDPLAEAAEDVLEPLVAPATGGGGGVVVSQAAGEGGAPGEESADGEPKASDAAALQTLVQHMGARYFVLKLGQLLMVFAALLGNGALVVWLIIEKATSLPVALGIIAGCNAGAATLLIIAATRYLDAAEVPLQQLTDQPWEQVVSRAVGNAGLARPPPASDAAPPTMQLATPDMLTALRQVVVSTSGTRTPGLERGDDNGGGTVRGGSGGGKASGAKMGAGKASSAKVSGGDAFGAVRPAAQTKPTHGRSRSTSIVEDSGPMSPLQVAAAKLINFATSAPSPSPAKAGVSAGRGEVAHRRTASTSGVGTGGARHARQRSLTMSVAPLHGASSSARPTHSRSVSGESPASLTPRVSFSIGDERMGPGGRDGSDSMV